MWAREQDGLCAEFISFEPTGKFHPDIRWVEVPEALRPWADHSYVIADGAVVPPSLDHLLAQMAGRLAARRWQQQTRGVVIAGRRWHTDAEAVGNITASLAMAAVYEARTGQPWATPWKTWTASSRWTAPAWKTPALPSAPSSRRSSRARTPSSRR